MYILGMDKFKLATEGYLELDTRHSRQEKIMNKIQKKGIHSIRLGGVK